MCVVMTVRKRRVNKEKKNHPEMWLETKPVVGNEGVQLTENPRPLRRPSRISYASRGHVSYHKIFGLYSYNAIYFLT